MTYRMTPARRGYYYPGEAAKRLQVSSRTLNAWAVGDRKPKIDLKLTFSKTPTGHRRFPYKELEEFATALEEVSRKLDQEDHAETDRKRKAGIRL